MAIDIYAESLHSLPDQSSRVPPKGVNPSTLWRWGTKGVRGIKLDMVMIGGIWHTSDEAVQRFVAAITAAAANGEQAPVRTNKQREKAIAAAERELAESGI